jgi:DNA polymerase-3 subunit beta
MDEVDTLSLDAGVLAGLLRSTTYAVSTDETRAHLNSLCIEWDKEQIRAVGTDGHRLAYAQAAVRCPVIRQALVPLKAIVELKKMVDEVEVPKGTSPQITMHIGKANAFFEVCGAIMIAKLVDAQYPNYKYVIPKYEDKGATVPRQPMIDAVKAVALAASDRAGGVAVSLNRNGLAISVDSSDKGGGEDEVPMEYNGPSVTIGFHAKYLTDTLSAIEGDEVVMRVGGELDPILFTPQVETDINVKSVVMPMRLG